MSAASTTLTPETFAPLVDHTLLKPEATQAQVEKIIEEAREFGPASVCVNGLWVPLVAAGLRDTDVLACAVVGFPLGAMRSSVVAAEAAQAVEDGAGELDMVIPVGLLRAEDDAAAESYVAAVRAAAPDVVLKVILETALLSDDQIVRACRVSVAGGADFVKTSTGFNPAGGATVEAVRLMRDTVGEGIGVKASGGVRSLEDAQAMVDAGASRLGMSGAVAVLEQLRG
ncbi:deoxyribose-phosphate aldolase [Nocardioidaceae bacterium]|nr:deoxyribose-phosphate aldolase [Nocardioidaceae bacterium]